MRGTSSTSGDIRNQEGSSINSIYGLICDGFINSQEEADEINANCPQFGTTVYPGDLKYRNVSGDNKNLLQMTRRLSEVQFHAIVIALI